LLLLSSARAQNLVPNASFEHISSCPENATPNQLDILDHWKQPGEGTPDVFNHCSVRLCRPKKNFAGSQQPFEGNGYAGFVAFSNEVKTYREYLQVPLKKNLEPGKNYVVTLHVSLSDNSGYAISNIGCGFNAGPLKSETNFALTPLMVLDCDSLVKDTAHWVSLVFHYTAKGNEDYFAIGNFRKYHEIKKIAILSPARGSVNNVDAYYYVDEVSVTEEEAPTARETDQNVTEYFTNDSTLVLSNLEFGYDSYALSAKDMALLEKVALYFKSHPQYCLTVEGHTDANGSYLYNNELSLKRAGSVCDFLENKGILRQRLQAKGYGYTRPVDRDLKSSKNRRVEIKLRKC
jgi:outer membrane protein OmpA-like peptidoglycan-associated protein